MRRALVVEDDSDIAELVAHYLAADGWTVEAVRDGREGLERIRTGDHELIVLDLQLPGFDGLALCAEARRNERSRNVPIVILTARGDETDRIVGLEMGADDYVVKPFSPRELMARIRAVFRRVERRDDERECFVYGEVEVDLGRHTVRRQGQEVHLTAKEFALLATLLTSSGRVLSRQRLLETVWGYSYAEGTRTVDVHVRRLREKLPELAPVIVTVKSLGYRFEEREDR